MTGQQGRPMPAYSSGFYVAVAGSHRGWPHAFRTPGTLQSAPSTYLAATLSPPTGCGLSRCAQVTPMHSAQLCRRLWRWADPSGKEVCRASQQLQLANAEIAEGPWHTPAPEILVVSVRSAPFGWCTWLIFFNQAQVVVEAFLVPRSA